MFDKAKQLYDLQKKARAIQKELKETEVEAKAANGLVSVVFNGEQHITEVSIDESLLKPENKSMLAGILTYHVISGNLDAAAVVAAIKKGKGKVVLTTVSGGKLTASIVEGKVILTDEKGGKATVTATDLKGTNGTIHVIDHVLLPK